MPTPDTETLRPSEPSRHWLRRLTGAFGPLLALIAVILFFGLLDLLQKDGGTFWTVRNLRTTAAQTATVSVAALGMTIIIIAGGIDLSAGTALALSATVLAYCLKSGWPWPVAIAWGVGTGCVAGFLNGTLISLLRVIPFIITLGTMTLYLGLAKMLADETTVRPQLDQVPPWLSDLVSVREQAIYPYAFFYEPGGPLAANASWVKQVLEGTSFPVGVWLALLLAGLLSILLRYTVFGRHLFAVGSNELTARLCGIDVIKTKILVYTLAGLFVGIAGMYQFSRLSSGSPTSGSGLELKIIAAVVIGGGSLSGGRGSVVGTLTGAAIMAVIQSGCTLLGLKNPVQDVILGAIIIAAVALDQWRQQRMAA